MDARPRTARAVARRAGRAVGKRRRDRVPHRRERRPRSAHLHEALTKARRRRRGHRQRPDPRPPPTRPRRASRRAHRMRRHRPGRAALARRPERRHRLDHRAAAAARRGPPGCLVTCSIPDPYDPEAEHPDVDRADRPPEQGAGRLPVGRDRLLPARQARALVPAHCRRPRRRQVDARRRSPGIARQLLRRRARRRRDHADQGRPWSQQRDPRHGDRHAAPTARSRRRGREPEARPRPPEGAHRRRPPSLAAALQGHTNRRPKRLAAALRQQRASARTRRPRARRAHPRRPLPGDTRRRARPEGS